MLLEVKLDNLVCKAPIPDARKKFHLVGLPYEMSCPDVVDALIEENSWLDLEVVPGSDNIVQIKHDPLATIMIHKVSKCRNIADFKVLVSISKNMIHSLGSQKLSIGFCKCKKYPVKLHNKCYNCHEVGHFASQCKNKAACSRCASTDHTYLECKSPSERCCSCIKNKLSDANHASYSTLCPSNRTTND